MNTEADNFLNEIIGFDINESRAERRKRLRRINYHKPEVKKKRYASHVKYKLKNLNRVMDNQRKFKYNMESGEYDKLYITQNGLCKICNQDKKLYVDHNHITGKVRGLLCQSCNIRIAGIEKIDFLNKAIQYLTTCDDEFVRNFEKSRLS